MITCKALARLNVWTLQQTEQPAEPKLHWANDAFLMDCQGNLILRGLPADINVMPQSLSKLTEDCMQVCDCTSCLDVLCCTEKTTIAHTSGAAQWTLESRSDKNEGCCHLRGSCGHKKPRSSLSAQMGHRGGLTAQRELLHGWVLYTYWKSIAIFQWQLQDIFEQQPLLSRVRSDFIQVFHCWKIREVKGLFDFISTFLQVSLKFLVFVWFWWNKSDKRLCFVIHIDSSLYWCRHCDFQWWKMCTDHLLNPWLMWKVLTVTAQVTAN